MAEIVETVPFDFNDLYTALQEKFADKGYDIEEGSNTSQLITAMTYLTSMLNVNTAVNINETILPLATKRDNALQDARALGYETAHKQSYKYRLQLEMEAGTHIIPKYTPFTAEGKTYYYFGNRLEYTFTEQDVTDENNIIELDVKEGTLYKFENHTDTLIITTTTVKDVNNNDIPQYYIDIPYIDVEESGIEVFLTYYDDLGNLYVKEPWYQTKQFMVDNDTLLDKQFIRMDNIDFKTPRIYFSFSGIGSGLRIGSIVEMNILTSSGIDGGLSDISDPTILSHSLSGMEIKNISLILQGSDEESLESIKQNAPLFHNSANRAVTINDYISICNRQQTVKESIVWGGDDEYPKCPGHIWFSFLPSTFVREFDNDEFNINYELTDAEDLVNWFIENGEIRSTEYNESGTLIDPGVWDVLDNYKIPTLEYHNRHPIYLDFEYEMQILKYNIKTSKADIHQEVFDLIDNFFTGTEDTITTEDFDIEYFHSNLEKRIDSNLSDLTGFNSLLTTKLMITSKNISKENSVSLYNDIYIPLAVPYESYFDTDGKLLTDVIPNIDTDDFIDGMGIYTDWSEVKYNEENIDGYKTSIIPMIIGSVRSIEEQTVTITEVVSTVIFDSINLYPDYHDVDEEDYTYEMITVIKNGVELENITDYEITDYNKITFINPLSLNDEITVKNNNHIGNYYIFNSYRKFILVHLFVDASGYVNDGEDGTDGLFSEAKSYLTTTDGFYGYTNNAYYITTEGFVLSDANEVSSLTGGIIRTVTPELYNMSSLKTENFDTVRYLNFNYASPNFKVMKNIVPRLKSVTFK